MTARLHIHPVGLTVVDGFGRNVDYLRISVTDLCDLRCRYCMPEEGVPKKDHSQLLTEEEILLAVEAAGSQK